MKFQIYGRLNLSARAFFFLRGSRITRLGLAQRQERAPGDVPPLTPPPPAQPSGTWILWSLRFSTALDPKYRAARPTFPKRRLSVTRDGIVAAFASRCRSTRRERIGLGSAALEAPDVADALHLIYPRSGSDWRSFSPRAGADLRKSRGGVEGRFNPRRSRQSGCLDPLERRIILTRFAAILARPSSPCPSPRLLVHLFIYSPGDVYSAWSLPPAATALFLLTSNQYERKARHSTLLYRGL
jgi:hypothetical protein